jgi:hypothetical protein
MRMKFNDEDMDASAFATYFDSNNPRDALRILVERGVEARVGCSSCHCDGEDEHAVTQAIVTDRQGTEGRAWFVHGPDCDLKRSPNWILADGWLCKGHMGRIGVLVKSFRNESEVLAPKPEDVEKAKKTLQSNIDLVDERLEGSGAWKIAEALKRRSQLKGKEVTKGYVSDFITVGSPTWVETIEGAPELGATTCELGTTTTAKSLRLRLLLTWLGSGKYVTGRHTEAGLTAGAEKVEGMGWTLRKGLLPSMDLSWAVIDNMHPHLLDKQIESRRNGFVQLSAMRNAELWARCRLKLLSNPSHPFDESMYKCTLLKVYDSKFIARFAFALFTYGVSTEERYSDKIVQPEKNDEKLLEAAKTVLKWNLAHEITFSVPKQLWPLIIEKGKKLEEKYGCEDIPLLLRSTPYKLSVLAYSFALLEGTTEPTERHVNLAYKWLDFCARDIELDDYAKWWRSQHQLNDSEYEGYRDTIETEIAADIEEHGGNAGEAYTFKLIEYLAKNEKGQRDELAAYINVDPKTVTKRANLLKGLGLLRSDMDGYHFTAKGVRFLKQWLPWIIPFASPSSPDYPAFEVKGGYLWQKLFLRYQKFPRIYSADIIGVIFESVKEDVLQKLLTDEPYAKKLHDIVLPFNPCNPKTGVTKGAKGINILKDVKDWCYANRNESGEVSLNNLTVFIGKELKQEPAAVIEQAFKQSILMPSNKPGAAVVV